VLFVGTQQVEPGVRLWLHLLALCDSGDVPDGPSGELRRGFQTPVHLQRVVHLSSPQCLVQSFQDEMSKQTREHWLKMLCQDWRRLHIHMHLQLNSRSPFRVASQQLSTFLRMPPLRLFDRDINTRACVEHYLNKAFYNLTTVALHDWETYSEMRALAQQKYALMMAKAHLPSPTLEQFLYNLNNQIFVERSNNNKHLNTINIRQLHSHAQYRHHEQ
jgi:WASH complex subunit 7